MDSLSRIGLSQDVEVSTAFAQVLVAAACADGVFDPSERAWIIQYFQRIPGTPKSVLDWLHNTEKPLDAQKTQNAVVELFTRLPPGSGRFFLFDCIGACYADGNLSKDEEKFIDSLGAKLDIQPKLVKKMKAICKQESEMLTERMRILLPEDVHGSTTTGKKKDVRAQSLTYFSPPQETSGAPVVSVERNYNWNKEFDRYRAITKRKDRHKMFGGPALEHIRNRDNFRAKFGHSQSLITLSSDEPDSPLEPGASEDASAVTPATLEEEKSPGGGNIPGAPGGPGASAITISPSVLSLSTPLFEIGANNSHKNNNNNSSSSSSSSNHNRPASPTHSQQQRSASPTRSSSPSNNNSHSNSNTVSISAAQRAQIVSGGGGEDRSRASSVASVSSVSSVSPFAPPPGGVKPVEVKTAAQRKREKELQRQNLPTTSMILRDPVMTYEDVTVAVQVIRGKNLARKDFIYSDAYCKVGLVDQSQEAFMGFMTDSQVRGQTQIVSNSLNPKWPPIKFVFNPIVGGRLHSLCFEVWDKDALKHDDFMGRVIVDLERRDQLKDIDADEGSLGVQMLNWLVLDNHKLPPEKRTSVSGAIYVAICWERLHEVQKQRRRKSGMVDEEKSHISISSSAVSDSQSPIKFPPVRTRTPSPPRAQLFRLKTSEGDDEQ